MQCSPMHGHVAPIGSAIAASEKLPKKYGGEELMANPLAGAFFLSSENGCWWRAASSTNASLG